jgi:hypothetical protein
MEWITTADVRVEAWRRVLEYANIDLAHDLIVAVHGPPRSSGARANYRKQATQIRVAVLQAREYFEAAEKASLFTSPNHAYYGLMSLASVVMLVRGTGDFSFDSLRRRPGNAHHGLLFTTGAQASTVVKDLGLLEESRIEVLNHGHFANWSTFLPTHAYSYGVLHQATARSKTAMVRPLGIQSLRSARELVGSKFTLRTLLQLLPDLAGKLPRYQLPVVHSRATHEKFVDADGGVVHQWALHSTANMEVRDAILDRFQFPAECHERIHVPDEDDATGALFSISSPTGARMRFRMPSWRSTVDFEHYAYADELQHEFLDLYLMCFGLSMLARYYPDLWVACLDSHGRAAKLIEAGVVVVLRKAPLLMLELIMGHPVVISTQRPPWFTL